MNANEKLLHNFYSSFQALDAEGMAACYHKDIEFTDPAFGTITGSKPGNMWRMLCDSQKDMTENKLQATFKDIKSEGDKGTAYWEAKYLFSQTGRRVHNKINASFEFKDGLIIKHVDEFNLHAWASQALGFKGKLLGWTGFFRKKLNEQTNKMLSKFENKISK